MKSNDQIQEQKTPMKSNKQKFLIYELKQMWQSQQNPANKKLIAIRLVYFCLFNKIIQSQIILPVVIELFQNYNTIDNISTCLEIVYLQQFQQLFPRQYLFFRLQVMIKLRDYYLQTGNINEFQQANKCLSSQLVHIIKSNLKSNNNPLRNEYYFKQLINCYQIKLNSLPKRMAQVQQPDILQQIIQIVEQIIQIKSKTNLESKQFEQMQQHLLQLYQQQGNAYQRLNYRSSSQKCYEMALGIAQRIKSKSEYQLLNSIRLIEHR